MSELAFITNENFKIHVQETIKKYGDKLEPYNLKKFNSNIIDPIKLIFDKNVYHTSWDEIVNNEIFRQRDKSNNNDIGYFHQNFFAYIDGCTVPETGWDVIYSNDTGIFIPGLDEKVKTIYVEMKNKHNTMNSASSSKTYMKMQNQLLQDDDCVCFLVEAIAKKSQNIKWETTLDKEKVSHKRIRRISMDQFYALLTGVNDAFYQVCMQLPSIISEVVQSNESLTPKDTVMDEIRKKHWDKKKAIDDISITISMYLLGFPSYIGFENLE